MNKINIHQTQQNINSSPRPELLVNIPHELRALPQWVTYRVEERNGKKSKIPYTPNGLHKASSTNPYDWGPFKDCLATYEAERVDGIGFVFTKNDHYFGIDLDHCLTDDGNVINSKPEASEIISRAQGLGLYLEKSISGDGVHIIGKGALVRSGKAAGSLNWIEGYDNARYFTMTGCTPDRKPYPRDIPDAQDFASWFQEKYLPSEKTATIHRLPTAAESPVRMFQISDEEVLRKAENAKNGEKFRRLYHDGELIDDTTGEIVQDNSQKDLALCSMLVYWTQDREQIDRLFRQSALIRQKWDERRGEETYGQRTINKALEYRALNQQNEGHDVFAASQDDEGSDLNTAIDEINEQYAMVWIGSEYAVMKRDGGEYIPTTKRNLRDVYANKKIKHHGKDVNPVDLWFESPSRKEYERVTFAPGQVLPKNELNLWSGWAIEPTPGDISPFLDLTTKVICAGDSELADWLLDWAAHIFQKPHELPSTAVLLRSGQGYGKNTWIDSIKTPLGKAFIQVNTQRQITGDFNGHLANKLLVHAAESVWGGDKSKVGPLKAMITDEDQTVEYKGRDAFSVKNYKRLILSSNESWPIPMDRDDRRFVVFECKKVWDRHDVFWSEYRDWLRAGGAGAIFHFLLNRDIAGFKPNVKPEAAQTKGFSIKLQSAEPLARWWHQVLQDGCPDESFDSGGLLAMTSGDWNEQHEFCQYSLAVPRQIFWEAFRNWNGATRFGGPSALDKTALKELCPSMKEAQIKKLNRKPCFTFSSLDQCRSEFARAFNTTVAEAFATDEKG